MPFSASSSLAQLIEVPMRAGRVEWIGVRPVRGAPVRVLEAAELVAGKGVAGDRYGNAGGARQVTLVTAESLAAIASYHGVDVVVPEALRRNVVVRGINLVALKGRRFRIGDAILEASGECHPCSRIEASLGTAGYNAARGLGGITARVVQGGVVRIGDRVEPTRSE